MRTHRWFKALACGLCLGAAAEHAKAQSPWDSGGEWVTADGSPAAAPQGQYAYPPVPPGAYQAPYATNDPGMLYPPNTPQGYSPWPQISPYGMGNYASDTHYNQGGNWFRQVLNKRRDYHFSVDALSVITAQPGKHTVGAPTMRLDNITRGLRGAPINTYGIGAIPGTGTGTGGGQGGTGTATTQPGSRLSIDQGVYPYPFLFETGDVTPQSIINNDLFPIHNFGVFGDFRTAGLQLNWGFEDESGSGFNADAWWAFDDDQTFQRGKDTINGVRLTQEIIINQQGLMLFTKNGAVSWDTGIPVSVVSPDDSIPGTDGGTLGTQKYDVMYRLTSSVESGGGGLQLYLPDLTYSNSVVRLRPVWAGKYIYLGESFNFRGVDSGLSYTIDGEDSATGGGGGGTTGTQPTFRPTGPPFTINNDLFETQVNTNTWSHLAGPTVGMRYDFGRSKNFKIWGQTSAGLMANYETVRVDGFNAGETVVTQFFTGTNMLNGDSRFKDTQRHAHVSPIFEQTIMAESRVLGALPGVKELPFISMANLRLGWTHTAIGKVARPADSVAWLGFPQAPKVDVNYKNWWMSKFHVGLEWNY